jgi:hypothetical protein
MRRLLPVALALLLTVALGAAASLETYYVQKDPGAVLVWDKQEAYLFVQVGYLGYRFSYLQYAFANLMAIFNVTRPPDNQTGNTTTIKITPNGVQSFGP